MKEFNVFDEVATSGYITGRTQKKYLEAIKELEDDEEMGDLI